MKNKIEGRGMNSKKEDKTSPLETEPPLSEKDQVKKAEERTREAQKNIKKLKSD